MLYDNSLTTAPVAPVYPNLTNLFDQLDPRLPHGFYRIPSLVTTLKGTLLAFCAGRFHRTDMTPNIIYLRRSEDDGLTWTPAQVVLSDPKNGTEYGGAPVVDVCPPCLKPGRPGVLLPTSVCVARATGQDGQNPSRILGERLWQALQRLRPAHHIERRRRPHVERAQAAQRERPCQRHVWRRARERHCHHARRACRSAAGRVEARLRLRQLADLLCGLLGRRWRDVDRR